MYTCRKNKK